jgi:hypothetical protein
MFQWADNKPPKLRQFAAQRAFSRLILMLIALLPGMTQRHLRAAVVPPIGMMILQLKAAIVPLIGMMIPQLKAAVTLLRIILPRRIHQTPLRIIRQLKLSQLKLSQQALHPAIALKTKNPFALCGSQEVGF